MDLPGQKASKGDLQEMPELEPITSEEKLENENQTALIKLSNEVQEQLRQIHAVADSSVIVDQKIKRTGKQEINDWLQSLFPKDKRDAVMEELKEYLWSWDASSHEQAIPGLWNQRDKQDTSNGYVNFLQKNHLENIPLEKGPYSGLPRLREYRRAFQLHKPTWPIVRDFIWTIRLDPYDQITTFLLDLYPHEAVILGFNLDTEDKDEKYQIWEKLPFPCCTCGTRRQMKEIPAILYHGWKERTVEAILKNVKTKSPYLLLSIASLSYMLPISIYLELRETLDQLNSLAAQLHSAMLFRQKCWDEVNLTEATTIDCYKEGTVLSMFEEIYRYTSHGGSIGACWLENREEKEPPYFIL